MTKILGSFGWLVLILSACAAQPAGGHSTGGSHMAVKPAFQTGILRVRCEAAACQVRVFDGFRTTLLKRDEAAELFSLPMPRTQHGVVLIASAPDMRPDVQYLDAIPEEPVLIHPRHATPDARTGWLVGLVFRSISGPRDYGIADMVPLEALVIHRGRAREVIAADDHGVILRRLIAGRYRAHVQGRHFSVDIRPGHLTVLPIELSRSMEN